MILIDTNVLLRSAQPTHSCFRAAKDAVKTARLRGYTPCIVPQVIYEYWVVATRPLAENGLGMTTSEAETDVAKLIEQFHLFRDERVIFERWRQLVVFARADLVQTGLPGAGRPATLAGPGAASALAGKGPDAAVLAGRSGLGRRLFRVMRWRPPARQGAPAVTMTSRAFHRTRKEIGRQCRFRE